MYLAGWQAFVYFWTRAPNKGRPCLEIRTWQVCPHCRHPVEVTSGDPEPLPVILERQRDGSFVIQAYDKQTKSFTILVVEENDVFPVKEYAERAAQKLNADMRCGICGTKSGLPDADLAKLKKELSRDLTCAWLHAEILSFASNVSYQDDLLLTQAVETSQARRDFHERLVDRGKAAIEDRKEKAKKAAKKPVRKPAKRPTKKVAKKPASTSLKSRRRR